MSLARRIIRGTFRLSIVAAVAGAAWGIYEGWSLHSKKFEDFVQFKMSYACAARQGDDELLAQQSGRTIDVSSFG